MSTLREQCKERLKIAFAQVGAVTGSHTFILVVDTIALKILSNTIKMMELINYGITSVEKLQLKRKRFQKIQVVYLIHPDSYQLLLDDYSDQANPQYHTLHILTLTKIPIATMTQISQNVELAKRIKTLKEINMNFTLHSFNEFMILNSCPESFLKTIQPEEDKYASLIHQTVDQLSTTLTTFSSFYIVEIFYCKSTTTNLAEKIALGLKEKLEGMFKLYDKNQSANYNSSAPPTTFLILDRAYDAASPMVRDFHYMPLLYEYKDVRNHRLEGVGKEKKVYNLDESDEIFSKYRHVHFADTITGILNDFQNFSQNHVAAKFEKNKENDNVNMENMAAIMKKIPEYTQSKDKYGLHIQLVNEIKAYYEKNKLIKIGQLEQDMICLQNDKGKKIKPNDIFNQLLAILPEVKTDEEKARLLSLALITLDLKPKDKNTLIQQCAKIPHYQHLHHKISALIGLNTYLLNPKKEKSSEIPLILDRHQTKLEETIKDISNGGQADLKFLRVGTDSKSQKHNSKNTNILGRKKIGQESDTKNTKPRLIVFMNSAMGYNEIRALSQFEGIYHMIYGSHNFVTQKEYLRLINSLEAE